MDLSPAVCPTLRYLKNMLVIFSVQHGRNGCQGNARLNLHGHQGICKLEANRVLVRLILIWEMWGLKLLPVWSSGMDGDTQGSAYYGHQHFTSPPVCSERYQSPCHKAEPLNITIIFFSSNFYIIAV